MATLSSSVGRAAAILTTGEVNATTIDLQTVTMDCAVTVEFLFTLGSLTNGIIRFYGSADNVTYYPIYIGVTAMTETLTADGNRLYVMPKLAGVRYLRPSVQGTGTVTSSSAAITYRYQPYMTASQTDGGQRIS